jgi:hypothetical protein
MPPKWLPLYDFAVQSIKEEHGRHNAEIRVAKELNEQLPEEVTILPNVRYQVIQNDRATTSLEIDFLVVWKGRGFLILEVKGGLIRYNERTGEWGNERNGWISQRSPVKQVEGAKNDFCEELRRKFQLPVNPRNLVDTLIILADIDSVVDSDGKPVELVDGYRVSKIVCKNTLPQLGAKIEAILQPVRQTANSVDPKLFKKVVHHFRPGVYGNINPTHILASTEKSIMQATDIQLDLMKSVCDNDFALVMGPAGTGKTVIGLSILDGWLKSGRDAYYVTENHYLVQGLRATPSFLHLKDRILSLHQFTEIVCGEPVENSTVGMISALMDLKDIPIPCAIVLDEAQGMEWNMYECILELMPFECLWVLLDPHQLQEGRGNGDVYRIGCLKNAARISPRHNCRNTKQIASVVKDWVNLPNEYVWDELPLGSVKPQIYNTKSELDHDQKLKDVISGHLSKGFLVKSIVVVSCLSGGRESVRSKYCNSKDSPLALWNPVYGNMGNNQLSVSSVDDFRGLESEIVVVTDVSEDNTFRANYMAATRAKVVLSIIHQTPNTVDSEDGRLGNDLNIEL